MLTLIERKRASYWTRSLGLKLDVGNEKFYAIILVIPTASINTLLKGI